MLDILDDVAPVWRSYNQALEGLYALNHSIGIPEPA
jgi:hypothetical protein